jgi:hypothetical protein
MNANRDPWRSTSTLLEWHRTIGGPLSQAQRSVFHASQYLREVLMSRWSKEPDRRPRLRRASRHGYPAGFDKPMPTELPDPQWDDHDQGGGHDEPEQDADTDDDGETFT